MAVWWITEAIPVYATALLPLALFPATGAVPIHRPHPPYGHELIFLFMGGFIIALSMQRWGLHRRIALAALQLVGTGPTRIVGGFMGITAVLSMWGVQHRDHHHDAADRAERNRSGPAGENRRANR